MAYIKGIFFQDIFSNPSNGYMVGLLRVKESSLPEYVNKVVTFTGIFQELKYKANYKFTGEFVSHNKYGIQFSVSSYELVLPTEADELVDFLSSDLFPIGEATAKKIVDKLGPKCINTIIHDEHALEGIPRLTLAKANKIREILGDYQLTNEIIMELTKMGFSTKLASAIIKKYSINSLKVIEDNIYILKDDIDISFNDLDKIARNIGYEANDERRLAALTIYMMNELTFLNGDTYLEEPEMYEYMVKNTDNVDRETFDYILLKLEKSHKIVIKKKRYYLKELYDMEALIADRMTLLNNMPRKKVTKLDDKIRQVEMVMNINYDESQMEAIKKAVSNNLTIITGGPGTGKTTIIKGIIRLLLEFFSVKANNIALLAPTGRAARKLMEITNIPAYTIHKYLGWDKDSDTFLHDRYNPKMEEYIIIDEASMVDTVLFGSLLDGTLDRAKIIMVGDYYQLPSVSQGQVLKDLIDSDLLDVVRLKQLYRQSDESYITTLAYQIKNREISDNYLNKYDDYNFISCPEGEISDIIKDIVLRALDKGYTDKDIQVLVPMYRGINGIDNINKMLQAIMNPASHKKNEITSGDVIYREGDKILQLVNDSDNGISNGDIGYIEAITHRNKKNEVIINFDGTKVTYTPKDFVNITHGYAISVHKSQGGEFKMVIMPIANSYKRMLYNKLVYTAVTRAKQSLIIVGNPEAFLYGIMNNYIDNRRTTLRELLESKYKK